MKIKAALNIKEVARYVKDRKPGSGLPAALSEKMLRAAIHDMRQYFQCERTMDSYGNSLFTGTFALMMRNLLEARSRRSMLRR